jgi:hypothetical protein
MSLNPNDILTTVTSALRTIQPLVAAMAGDPSRIYSFYDLYAKDAPRKLEEYQMLRPSILVEWNGRLGGNFDGSTLFKHHISLTVRMQNPAQQVNPINYAHLMWLISDGPVNGTTVNIRYTTLMPYLDICDPPSSSMAVDETSNDVMKVDFVWPEIGDYPNG